MRGGKKGHTYLKKPAAESCILIMEKVVQTTVCVDKLIELSLALVELFLKIVLN